VRAVWPAEVVVSEFGWSGKVFNLCAFLFLRTALGLGWYAAPAYALVWLGKLKARLGP